jgi:hypothetical protein
VPSAIAHWFDKCPPADTFNWDAEDRIEESDHQSDDENMCI